MRTLVPKPTEILNVEAQVCTTLGTGMGATSHRVTAISQESRSEDLKRTDQG